MQIRKTMSGNCCTIYFMGKFGFDDNKSFKSEVLTTLDDKNVNQLTINLQGLEGIDSAGMGLLLILKDKAESLSKILILSSAQGYVEKMIKTARFDEQFNYIKEA